MTQNSNISVATSILPAKRMEIQKSAIQSWIGLGLDVVSLNTPLEIAQLDNEFPQVKFVPASRDGRLTAGRPVIYLSDIINYFKRTNYPIYGIINSDIFVLPESKLMTCVKDNYLGSLISCPRTEVSTFGAKDGALDPYGYDAFFFDHRLLDDWTETQFCLGMPFWDHWLPVTSILAGRKIFKLTSLEVQHIPHLTDRVESFLRFNDYFADLTISQFKNNELGFGDDFDFDLYENLRAAVTMREFLSIGEPTSGKKLEDLALFFDNLTKYVIRFINKHSEEI